MPREGAVVAGLICLDIMPSLARASIAEVLQPGQTVEVGPISFHTGGAVANTGLALARLGIPTRLVGLVGDDAIGAAIRHLVRQESDVLADGIRVVPGTASPCTIVLSPPGGDRAFITHPGTNHVFGAEDVPDATLEAVRLFHFGYPPYMRRMYLNRGRELVKLFRRARSYGLLTSLDLAFPETTGSSGQVNWRQILSSTLPLVDFFLPSADELLFMLRGEQCASASIPASVVAELAIEALEMGAAVVALKAGEHGLYVRTGERVPDSLSAVAWQHRELWAPCFVPQPLIGTTGAGDATIAGFLAGLLRDLPLERILAAAVAVGACCVEAVDALSGIRGWEETFARAEGGWPRAQVVFDSPGWRWDSAQELWIGPNDRAAISEHAGL